MRQKPIAAALLVVMVAWAEMALAPMLLMHTGHVPAAREMSENMAAHHHVMPSGHACCPGLGKTVNPVALELAAGSLPCEDGHRCCFQQGPQSVPARLNTRLTRELAPAEVAEVNPVRDEESHLFPATEVAPAPPPNPLGMVLRV
ncbi:MAG: hypothetical protein WBX02_08885 [Terriglobales bacterium]